MKPDKIYLDNTFLVQWFLHKFNPKKYDKKPKIIEFFSRHKEMEKYISLFSVAELVKTLKHDNKFRGKKLNLKTIGTLIGEMQNFVGFDIILKDSFDGVEVNGVVVSIDILEFLDKHDHIIDCVHVDLAKSHELFFITDEKKIGRIKDLYKNIMTGNKLMKQFR